MFPSPRVLVIDDDQMLRNLLEALLPMDGCQVVSAEGGDEAIRLLQSGARFDLILTDLNMPGLEGAALANALRAAAPEATLLVGMSGSEPDATVRRALDSFLLKPFNSDDLHQAIQVANQAANQAAQSAPAPAAADAEVQSASGEVCTVCDLADSMGPGPLDIAIFDSLSRVIPLPQLGELYEMTIVDIGKRLGRIQDAVSAGDLPAAQREAHAIKGSCGMVGASDLQSLAAAIEGGTTVNTFAIAQIPSACLRLRRMLDPKLQTA